MRNFLFLILSISLVKISFGQDKPELIPDKIEIEYGQCDSNSVYILELLENVKKEGFQNGSEFYHDNVRTVDLNKDGQCEYILNYYNGGSDIVKEIYIVQNEKLKKVSEIWGGHLWGEYDENGYIQIINIYYTGQKTNPVWKFSILRFDGEKYSSYYAPDLTYGKMRELGLQEYKQKNYEFAEIYFRNVLSVYQYENSTDINNLSLVLIKRNKLKEAKELLFEELKSRKSPETFYNLSVVFRQQNDKKNELKYLVESNQMKQSTFKENRIKELKDELNNSR